MRRSKSSALLHSRRALGILGVIVLAAAAMLLTFAGLQRTAVGQAAYSATVPRASAESIHDQVPTLLVVGDSFVSGTGDPSFQTYPQIVANRMGWNLALDGQGASGFVERDQSPGEESFEPFIERLDRDRATYNVDFVLVDGGRNDLGMEPEPVISAIGLFYKKVRSYWPDATIIAMTPAYVTPEIPGNYPVLADAIRKAAAEIDAFVIDPVAEAWYQQTNLQPLLWYDNVHLGKAGNAYYADRIVEDLKQFGL